MRRYPGGIFFIFGGVCVVSAVWIFKALPETKGLSLEQLEAMIRRLSAKKLR